MNKLSNTKFSNALTMIYFDRTNVHGDDMYITYDTVPVSNLTFPFGASICGMKDTSTNNRAIFYIFGGKTEDFSVTNMFIRLIVDITGGGPVLTSEEILINDPIPPERYFTSMNVIDNVIWLYGGMDINDALLSDIQKYDIALETWEEVTVVGHIPSARLFTGGLG